MLVLLKASGKIGLFEISEMRKLVKSSAIYFKTQQINKIQLKHINKDSVMLQNIKIPTLIIIMISIIPVGSDNGYHSTTKGPLLQRHAV